MVLVKKIRYIAIETFFGIHKMKLEWGKKIHCPACMLPFYSLQRTSLLCPNCGNSCGNSFLNSELNLRKVKAAVANGNEEDSTQDELEHHEDFDLVEAPSTEASDIIAEEFGQKNNADADQE
ncbi:MAG: FYDLN acid domain-containing protein [Holosporales bacterium]|jgi:hypothetical protein|nr:FYDLN acid domain-containing protein [Holosporales bacterium]